MAVGHGGYLAYLNTTDHEQNGGPIGGQPNPLVWTANQRRKGLVAPKVGDRVFEGHLQFLEGVLKQNWTPWMVRNVLQNSRGITCRLCGHAFVQV